MFISQLLRSIWNYKELKILIVVHYFRNLKLLSLDNSIMKRCRHLFEVSYSFVTCVLKRDAVLPHLYVHMETMPDAKMMSIAWPFKKLNLNLFLFY
jgi:hypothetical protein